MIEKNATQQWSLTSNNGRQHLKLTLQRLDQPRLEVELGRTASSKYQSYIFRLDQVTVCEEELLAFISSVSDLSEVVTADPFRYEHVFSNGADFTLEIVLYLNSDTQARRVGHFQVEVTVELGLGKCRTHFTCDPVTLESFGLATIL